MRHAAAVMRKRAIASRPVRASLRRGDIFFFSTGAFCAATGATKENFRPFEYMAWIGNKHKEFCEKTKMGKFRHEYHREFCKFLGVEEHP